MRTKPDYIDNQIKLNSLIIKKITGNFNESADFIPLVMKNICGKTRQQDCISRLRKIRVKNVKNVIIEKT